VNADTARVNGAPTSRRFAIEQASTIDPTRIGIRTAAIRVKASHRQRHARRTHATPLVLCHLMCRVFPPADLQQFPAT
jgi:hypothetical protein